MKEKGGLLSGQKFTVTTMVLLAVRWKNTKEGFDAFLEMMSREQNR